MSNTTSYISVTLYDMSGAPLNPYLVREFEAAVERMAKKEQTLAINVVKEQ
jgi:hypothetical protein